MLTDGGGVRKGPKLNNDLGRLKRQSEGGDFKQGCTTTGYESRFRELCEEEFEEVCKVRGAIWHLVMFNVP